VAGTVAEVGVVDAAGTVAEVGVVDAEDAEAAVTVAEAAAIANSHQLNFVQAQRACIPCAPVLYS